MSEWLNRLIGKKPAVKPAETPTTFQKFGHLWKTLVPISGEADTLQGEIVRVVGRLEDEYNRNGNINWKPGGYHSKFLDFIKLHLADKKTFDLATVQKIQEAAEQVRLTAEDLTTEMSQGEEIQVQKHNADSAIEYLIERAVEWCDKNPNPVYRPAGQDCWIMPE